MPGCIRSSVWPGGLIALHVLSDGLIALAYVWIPITLIAVWRKRDDIPFNWTLLCFAGFIVSCGLTHVMSIVTTWWPYYWLAGEIKAVTGLISIATAAVLAFRVYPSLLAIPSATALRIEQRIDKWRETLRTLRSAEARAALAALRPMLVGALVAAPEPDRAMTRLETVLEQVYDRMRTDITTTACYQYFSHTLCKINDLA